MGYGWVVTMKLSMESGCESLRKLPHGVNGLRIKTGFIVPYYDMNAPYPHLHGTSSLWLGHQRFTEQGSIVLNT